MPQTIGRTFVRSSLPRSVDDCEDVIREFGYDSISFERRGREFAAISYNGRNQRAEAIGRDAVTAAQSLVRTITRP